MFLQCNPCLYDGENNTGVVPFQSILTDLENRVNENGSDPHVLFRDQFCVYD